MVDLLFPFFTEFQRKTCFFKEPDPLQWVWLWVGFHVPLHKFLCILLWDTLFTVYIFQKQKAKNNMDHHTSWKYKHPVDFHLNLLHYYLYFQILGFGSDFKMLHTVMFPLFCPLLLQFSNINRHPLARWRFPRTILAVVLNEKWLLCKASRTKHCCRERRHKTTRVRCHTIAPIVTRAGTSVWTFPSKLGYGDSLHSSLL